MSDIPKTPHYAVYEENSVHIPGDQRSIDAPGHGYPAYTEHFLKFIAFDTKDELLNYLKMYSDQTRSWRIVYSTPVTVETTVDVVIA